MADRPVPTLTAAATAGELVALIRRCPGSAAFGLRAANRVNSAPWQLRCPHLSRMRSAVTCTAGTAPDLREPATSDVARQELLAIRRVSSYPKQRREARDVVNNPRYHFDPVVDWSIANVALQRWLGLLSRRRNWLDPHYRGRFSARWAHLNTWLLRAHTRRSLTEGRPGRALPERRAPHRNVLLGLRGMSPEYRLFGFFGASEVISGGKAQAQVRRPIAAPVAMTG